MTLLKRFQALGLDCSPVGLCPGPAQGGYFCTPRGMTVLGWEGCGGIHFGRIRGYGDMVFAVNPMPAGEQYVRPLAHSFRDFLRLLLACGSAAALEQMGDWTREQYDAWLRAPENAVTAEGQAVLSRIAAVFHLTPMEDPFGFVKEIQASFDGGRLRYTDEYYDTLGLERPSRGNPGPPARRECPADIVDSTEEE